jgi:hypothetical protein
VSFADAPAKIIYEEAAAAPTEPGTAPAPTTGGAPAPAPGTSGSIGGNDWSMAIIMVACVVAVAVPAFAIVKQNNFPRDCVCVCRRLRF